MKAAVAHTEAPATPVAARELIDTCRAKLAGETVKAGMLFAAIDYDHEELLSAICDAFPGIELIGCSTDGEVSSELRFRQDSATFIAFASDSVQFRAALGRDVDQDPARAARTALDAARHPEGGSAKLCFTLPAGLVVSASDVTEALLAELGADFPIVGGVAGDDWRFKGTKQFHGREVVDNGLPLLLLYGDLAYSIGIASGWTPLGRPATVTSSEGARIHTIDGEPAHDFYKRYFGDHVEASPEYPLAIVNADGSFALRAPFEIGDDGSILFVGDVPNGATVQLTQATREEILRASRESISKAFATFDGVPSAAVLFSCAARKHLLGTKTDQEYALLEDRVEGVETCGFYTYGEIAPHQRGRTTDFHNQTFVAVLLGSSVS